MSSDHPQTSKKPYQVPRLILYGDIRQVTEANATMNPAGDGPGKART